MMEIDRLCRNEMHVNQGDQIGRVFLPIGRFFDDWAIVYFGQFFEKLQK
jgi:hypothetical protein